MSAIELYKDKPLPALEHDVQSVLSALKENLGNAGIRETDLTVIKFPAGGQTFWTIPELEGEKPAAALVGVIVYQYTSRAYWPHAYGEGDDEDKTPECASTDGLIGFGSPGGNCNACPLSKFGTKPGKNGKLAAGQACSQKQNFFLLRDNNTLPDLIRIPAASLDVAKKFMLNLSKSGIPYHKALVAISLRRVENSDNIPYSEVEIKFSRVLTDEEHVKAKDWNTIIRTLAEQAAQARAAQMSTQETGGAAANV